MSSNVQLPFQIIDIAYTTLSVKKAIRRIVRPGDSSLYIPVAEPSKLKIAQGMEEQAPYIV